MTKPHSAYATSTYRDRIPSANNSAPTMMPTDTGVANWRLRFDNDALRHAMSGPIPVSASNNNPSGTFTALKNGGPTVILFCVAHSDKTGNTVPKNTAKAMQ